MLHFKMIFPRCRLFTRCFVIAIKNDLAPSGNFFCCSFESPLIQARAFWTLHSSLYLFLMTTEALFIGNIGGSDLI